MSSQAPMLQRPIWFFWGIFALLLALAIGFGLTWWFGVAFAAVFLALPLLAWLTLRSRDRLR